MFLWDKMQTGKGRHHGSLSLSSVSFVTGVVIPRLICRDLLDVLIRSGSAVFPKQTDKESATLFNNGRRGRVLYPLAEILHHISANAAMNAPTHMA